MLCVRMTRMVSTPHTSAAALPPLLPCHHRCPHPLRRLTQHVLRARGADDDLRAHGRLAHLHAAVAVLGQLPHQELIELGVEHAVRNELRSGRGGERGLRAGSAV
jgi:hypothetical protein